ncbi:condensation domain-containing protein, partial [Aquimarina sp. RZ0]|uniref:condensation domain-containing protein n=1 Tax=Aquimarina sp. RZ0 TaxID=2607730 RepID=UPI0012556AC3
MENKVLNIIERALESEIDLKVEDDKLILNFENDEIDNKLLEDIKAQKEFIIKFIKDYNSQNTSKTKVLLPLISVEEHPDRIPLSYGQERFWFLDQLQGSLEYHIPVILELRGSLDRSILSSSLKAIVSRHEVLRTVISSEEGIGYQEVLGSDLWELEHQEFIGDSDSLEAAVLTYINRAFDLSSDYMFRSCLYDLGADRYILVGVFHHISSDGWSSDILVGEFLELYRASQADREADLGVLPFQYSDYALWQKRYVSGTVLESELSYWESQLSGVVPLVLPTDYVRPPVQSHSGSVVSFTLDSDLPQSLLSLSQESGATLFMTLLASFKILLSRYSGESDICVGTPIANRTQSGLEGMIGFFVNTLALRNTVDSRQSFRDFLMSVKQTTLNGYDHQLAPFEKVVDRVVETRDMSRSPLFDVLFVLENIGDNTQDITLEGLDIAPYEGIADTTSQFDLTFTLRETSEGLELSIEYCTDLFTEATIQRMCIHYQELLSSIVVAPDANLGALSILTKEEEHQLLEVFNDTVVDYPTDKTIVDLFEDQVLKTPNHIAV